MNWLHSISVLSLGFGIISFTIILIDLLAGNAQKMTVMNVVWPVTALYAGPLALWAYFRIGRLSTKKAMQRQNGEDRRHKRPFWQMVLVGATHCGSGCTLGDIAAEWIVVAYPLTLLGHKIFGTWLLDFIFAFILGVAFQYFSIKPMRNVTPAQALWAALKADTLSLAAWQLGMYGFVAIVTFGIFRHELPKTEPDFWFMMQMAMLAGFVASFPVNWWLLRIGVKERM